LVLGDGDEAVGDGEEWLIETVRLPLASFVSHGRGSTRLPELDERTTDRLWHLQVRKVGWMGKQWQKSLLSRTLGAGPLGAGEGVVCGLMMTSAQKGAQRRIFPSNRASN
jgi:hypothetical protein